MAPARAADGDREVGLALALVERQEEAQQILEPRESSSRLSLRTT